MSNKTVVNSLADGIVQLAILCIYMRRIINYDWATVNISVLIQQRNISFQNDIFLKTMRLGVLSWEKLKNCESHDSIESSPGRVKKGSKIHKLLSQVGHGANLKHIKFHMKTTYRPVKGTKSQRQKLWAQCTLITSWSQNGNDRSTTIVVLTSEVFVRSD